MNGQPSYRKIWVITYPIILSLLAQNIILVTDTAFLGRVGEVELGAAAIGGLFYYSIFILGFGFGNGAQILIGRRNGEKLYSETGRIFDQTMYFFVILGLILIVGIKTGAPLFFRSFVASPAIYDASIEFIGYRMWGMIFAFTNVAFRAFYVGITSTRLLGYNAAIMAVVNIILDYILIFGKFGFPEMGIGGAALASAISEGVAAAFFIIATIRDKKNKQYCLFRLPRPDLTVLSQIWRISVFIMLQSFISLAGWFIFFLVIEKTGERPLAISNIIRSIYMLLMIHIWAFCSTTSTLVSNAIGEGYKQRVMPIITRINIFSGLSTLVITVIALLIPDLLIRIYTVDAVLINSSRPVLYVIALALLPLAVASNWFNAISGTANTRMALLIETIAIIIYLYYVYHVTIILHASLMVVWTSEFVYSLLIGVLSYLYIKSGKWKKINI